MRENPFVTQVKLMEEFNLTRKQIQNIIQYLRLNGLVEREGSNRSGKWIVKKQYITTFPALYDIRKTLYISMLF